MGSWVSWNPTPWGKPNWGVRKDAWAPPHISQLKVRPSGCPGQHPLGTGSPRKQSLLHFLLPPLFAARVPSISLHPLFGTLWPTFPESIISLLPTKSYPWPACAVSHMAGGTWVIIGQSVVPECFTSGRVSQDVGSSHTAGGTGIVFGSWGSWRSESLRDLLAGTLLALSHGSSFQFLGAFQLYLPSLMTPICCGFNATPFQYLHPPLLPNRIFYHVLFNFTYVQVQDSVFPSVNSAHSLQET